MQVQSICIKKINFSIVDNTHFKINEVRDAYTIHDNIDLALFYFDLSVSI